MFSNIDDKVCGEAFDMGYDASIVKRMIGNSDGELSNDRQH